MRKIISIVIAAGLMGCSSTSLISSWKNENKPSFSPKKTLVVGMTQNLSARQKFESSLKKEFLERNSIAEESLIEFGPHFSHSQKSEEEIKNAVEELRKKGYDAVLTTVVKGVEKKTSYTPESLGVQYRGTRFGRYYFLYQDIYYNPSYYKEYNVYRVESALYDIKNDSREPVWVGNFAITDPANVDKTVKDYVKAIIQELENQKLISNINY
ncbi:hypothetical protein [Leptobacterium sp. I13]|uniref:hypothetical protein n=1 Tax=Leptobacterium meishanense TaxID=3128904 RepID=UPI0030ED9DB9